MWLHGAGTEEAPQLGWWVEKNTVTFMEHAPDLFVFSDVFGERRK